MKLSEILNLGLIEADLKASDKAGVIEEMVNLLIKNGKIQEENKTEVLSAIMAREELMSTGIGHGVGIPHAKTNVGNDLVACFGRSDEGIDFKSLDGEPVYLFFLLLAPEHTTGLHIRALARISRLLKHNYVREMLKTADTPEKILDLIRKEEAKLL